MIKQKVSCFLISSLFLVLPFQTRADTIGRYTEIAKSIPEATLKADAKSQAWAHSARTILAVAEESITETMLSMQQLAVKTKNPLFCMPSGESINVTLIHNVLMKKTENLSDSDAKLSLSDVAVEAIAANYPCNNANPFQSAQNALFAPKDYRMQSVSR